MYICDRVDAGLLPYVHKQVSTSEFNGINQLYMKNRHWDQGKPFLPQLVLLSYAPSSLIVVSVVVFAPFTSLVFFCKFRIKYTKVRFSFFLNALLCDLKVKLYQSK